MAEGSFSTEMFTHGTLECRDPEASKRFYREFLGLHCVRMSPNALYLWHGGEWLVACINAGDLKQPQGRENRFGLRVATDDELEQAHRAAMADAAKWKISQVEAITGDAGSKSFFLCDLDENWWEIYSSGRPNYDHLFDTMKEMKNEAASL